MTDAEFTTAVGQLEATDTEIADLEQKKLSAIASARVHNTARKAIELQQDQLRATVAPLREAVAQHAQEQRRLHAEKAKAEAAAKAAQPQPPNVLEQLAAQVAKLTEQLAAKG